MPATDVDMLQAIVVATSTIEATRVTTKVSGDRGAGIGRMIVTSGVVHGVVTEVEAVVGEAADEVIKATMTTENSEEEAEVKEAKNEVAVTTKAAVGRNQVAEDPRGEARGAAGRWSPK